MVAVSGVVYRLFTNVVRDFLSDWCMQFQKIPDTQFGFVPGRNTLQPMFILRHLVEDARADGCQKLYTAFVDYTQAYDCVDRAALWSHLESLQLPEYLLGAVKEIYSGDSYVLVDGHRVVPAVQPAKGVKQGCPLSPLLFALFLNDFVQKMGAENLAAHGVPLRQSPVPGRPPDPTVVSHLFYADDLVLVSRSPRGLQWLLDRLSEYGRVKGLSVNVNKSVVVVFNSFPRQRSPPVAFSFQGLPLAVVDEFKYLGVIFDKGMTFAGADNHWARVLMGAMQRVTTMAKEFGLAGCLDIVLQLYQSYAVSSGLYGSHVWATQFLDVGRVWDSQVQRRHLCFLRSLVHVRGGTCRWPLLAELGQTPFFVYWWKAVVKFWNGLLQSDNPLLVAVLRSDVLLADHSSSCWSRHFRDGLTSLVPVDVTDPVFSIVHVDGVSLAALDATSVLDRVWHSYAQLWQRFEEVDNVRVPGLAERKHACYSHWFHRADEFPTSLPRYFFAHGLSKREVVANARFRLGSHHLFVERGRFQSPPVPWEERTCRRCLDADLGLFECAVDDEFHMVFDCSAFRELRSDLEFAHLFADPSVSMRDFCSADDPAVGLFIARCMDAVDVLVSDSAEQPIG